MIQITRGGGITRQVFMGIKGGYYRIVTGREETKLKNVTNPPGY